MEKSEIQDKVDEGAIHFLAIMEMVGKPKEHVEESFKKYVDEIKGDEQFTIISDNIKEAVKMEEKDELYSTFAEIEILAKDFSQVYDYCFKFMPASIEIYAPERMTLQSSTATGIVNDFIAKMHDVDMHAKKMNQTAKVLGENIGIIIQNAVNIVLRFQPSDEKTLCKMIGVPEKEFKRVLEHMEKKQRIAQKDGKYYLVKHEPPKTKDN